MNNIVESQNTAVSSSTGDLVLDPTNMKSIIDFATFMASGTTTLPAHLQKKPSDCMAIVIQSMQWGMNPFAVAQKTHLVSGALGYEAQLVNAVVSSSRAIDGRFHYRYEGNWEKNGADRHVIVGAKLKGEDEIQWGEPLYPAKVTVQNSPLWKTAEKQQASYLAVKYWARLFCPAVMLGVYTPDELEEAPRAEKTINPKSAMSVPDEVKPAAIETDEENEELDAEFDLLMQSIKSAGNMEHIEAIRQDCRNFPNCGKKKELKAAFIIAEDRVKALEAEGFLEAYDE